MLGAAVEEGIQEGHEEMARRLEGILRDAFGPDTTIQSFRVIPQEGNAPLYDVKFVTGGQEVSGRVKGV